MTWDIFSKSKLQYTLTKLKKVFVLRSEIVDISLAEYNALSEEEKKGKTFFVYDAD